MLQGLGVSIERLKISDDAEGPEKPSTTSWVGQARDYSLKPDKLNDQGKLIADEGKSIYVEE